MDTKILNVKIPGPGAYEVETNNGTLKSSPTQYNFDNDLSRGSFSNSLERHQSLKKVEHVKLNHNFTVGGTSQSSVGGIWVDVGSRELFTGQAQTMVASTNAEIAALLTQYPEPNDSEPEYNPLPNIADNIVKASNMTAESQFNIPLPTITKPADIPIWIAAWTANIQNQATSNAAETAKIAAVMTVEQLDEQIKRQEKYLTDKYGEDLYKLLFKKLVENGAVYTKDMVASDITKEDLYKAAFSDDKAQKRNTYAAKIG